MSPDRLAELRRQRALVAQHLAWIDAELTAAGATQPPATGQAAASSASLPGPSIASPADDSSGGASASSASVAAALPAAPDPALALANARADEIIEKYRATEAIDPAETKRGCLVLFGALFVLGAATLLAIYYFGYAKN